MFVFVHFICGRQLIALLMAIVMVHSVPLEGEKGETAALDIVDDLDTAELFAKSYGKAKAPKAKYGAPKAKKPKAKYGAPKAKAPKAPKGKYGAPKAKAPKSSYGKPKEETKKDKDRK